MNMHPTRRRFVKITPFAGIALLAACSPEPEAPATPVTPAPAPTPAPTTPEPAAAPAQQAPATTTAPAAATPELPMLQENDPLAVTLGYVEDATRADTTRFNNYVPGSNCANCALYQGKPGDAAGPCPLFAGKAVAAAGWCTSWVKKA